MLACPYCEKRSQLKKWILISNYYYVRPYSCNGGDYWSHEDDYNLVCPKCQEVSRTYKPCYIERDLKENKRVDPKDQMMYHTFKFVEGHKQYFGERLDSYGDGTNVEVLREKKRKSDQAKKDIGW